jgi:hypothetical protein
VAHTCGIKLACNKKSAILYRRDIFEKFTKTERQPQQLAATAANFRKHI